MTKPASTGGTKSVFLHVGCRKSGTSALQHGFGTSAEALAAQGLSQPYPMRQALQRRFATPVRRHAEEGAGGGQQARQALNRLARRIRTSAHPRHLVSLEALAEWDAATTGLVVDALAEFDVHVVITARPWALTIPSEWQQRVKSRYTGGYLEYAAALRDPPAASSELAGEARDFHRRQDVADVARRWWAEDPRVRAHVILVPPSSASPDLRDLFCEVVGADPSLVALPDRVVNPSLSYAHAEVLRLVNVALGDRLTDLRGDYRASVRRWITVRALMNQRGDKIRLPREHESWAAEQGERQLRELRQLGCEVIGDPDGYVRPRLEDDDFVPASGDELARTAAAVIAHLAVNHDAERRLQAEPSAEEADEQDADD